MAFIEEKRELWCGELAPEAGALAELWRGFGAEVIVGHPTYGNAATIGRQLAEGIAAAHDNFAGRRVSFVVSDGTWTAASGDRSTVETALREAGEALDRLAPRQREGVQVVVTPYEGYGDDRTPGKGSALKLIFDEMASCEASMLILLDGDLRNDMGQWQAVFARVERAHRQQHGDRPFFVTARYARHFVDASLTRFIVGPLTTLVGRYVPGGISGDIVLSREAVAHERQGVWTEARRKYGTDISTTFDNIADPQTVIYEVYLGAKLHDITDEGKLSVMPGEVIGAALERLLHWERGGGLVTRQLADEARLTELEVWGPQRTGIAFVDPGPTAAFDVDTKINVLLTRFDDFVEPIRRVQGDEVLSWLRQQRERLGRLRHETGAELRFLGVDQQRWIEMLQRAVAYLLVHGDCEAPKHCLNYLYTAAFVEFVKDRLADLGLRTLEAVRRAQHDLGVPSAEAETFYGERVDSVARELALGFYQQRTAISRLVAQRPA